MPSGFIMLKPGDEISRQLEQLAKLDDATHVERFREFEDWCKHTQDIPGGSICGPSAICSVATSSSAARSRSAGAASISVCSRCRYISSVAADHITPPDQVFAVANYASTPDELVRRDIVPGGHLGLFMGHQSLREHWPPMLEQVRQFSRRSTPGQVSPPRR